MNNMFLRNNAQLVMAVLVGIAGSYLWGLIAAQKIQTSITSWEAFYFFYSSIAALFIPWFGTSAPWRWVLALIIAHYLAGYAFIKFWGQLGPFDLIFMAFYSMPCLFIGYAIYYLRKKT